MKRTALLLSGVLLCCAANAKAQIFLKPESFKAHAIRVQNLKTETRLIGPLAWTRVTISCTAETGNADTAAQFIASKPRDASIIEFSYQSRGNSYDGRVVNSGEVAPREVAEPKVQAPGKDNVLLGLNAQNSFRARLYPVSNWNGLKISWTYVQVLSAPADRFSYRLPLTQLVGATMRLQNLDSSIAVEGEDIARVGNNYNLPISTKNGARVVAVSQKNYRVMRDLEVTVVAKTAPLRATLLTSPNAKNDGGFYVLALSGNQSVRAPIISHPGFQAKEIVPSANTMTPGKTLLESGTYSGTIGSTAVSVQGDGANLQVVKVQPIVMDAARSLWALQQISALAAKPQTPRATLIKLSREYSIPIRETMWLATSENDWRFYQRALVSAQLDPLVREWWINVADGHVQSVRAKALRARIAQISRANNLNAEQETYIRLGSAYAYAIWQKYDDYAPRNKRKVSKAIAEKRIARLDVKMQKYLSAIKVKNRPNDYDDISSGTYFQTRDELYDLRNKIIGEYRKPFPDYKQLEKWEKRFTILYGSTDSFNPQLSFWKARLTSLNLDQQQRIAEKTHDKAALQKLKNARQANSNNAYFTNNIGDPPIYVSAAANARQVVAIMPDGKIKTLEFNAKQKRWEGNYDIPNNMKEGNYAIRVIIVNADNSRRSYDMKFRVDFSPPSGKGNVLIAPQKMQNGEEMLRLEIEHGGDVARVTALLPWGEKVSLLPSTSHDHKFFAIVRAPREYSGKPIKITYILVDRAHNLTKIEAESVSPTTSETP